MKRFRNINRLLKLRTATLLIAAATLIVILCLFCQVLLTDDDKDAADYDTKNGANSELRGMPVATNVLRDEVKYPHYSIFKNLLILPPPRTVT